MLAVGLLVHVGSPNVARLEILKGTVRYRAQVRHVQTGSGSAQVQPFLAFFRVSADFQYWEAKQGTTGEPNSHETRSGVPS